MGYVWKGPTLRVAVGGRFVGQGQWIVHGIVERPSVPFAEPTEGDATEARLELMIGVARESRKGRARGARSVHVVIEGDREMEGLFRVDAATWAPATRGVALR